jgi:hypothetical protein
MNSALGFIAVMAVVFFVTPLAYPPADITLTQAAAITLLAFVCRAVLAPEMPDIYLVNGTDTEEDAEWNEKNI